ncbi:MAG: 3-methyl-2-oxobutanoate hydroxymethyltransferase [Ktedonobacteraceae bacterium]
MQNKVTVPMIKARKGGDKLKMVTAYDTPMAQVADQAGADMILVGDSLATTVLGYEDTLPATIDIMIHHTAAVARANPAALIVGDMPWLSYHISVEETVRNAGRLLREGHAEVVKLEGGRKRLPMIEAILSAEIPVMGHLGLTPQSIHTMGGYRVQGKKSDAARALLDDARALAEVGVFAIVLEGIPDVLAQVITEEIAIPTIGIGAGPHCDGQVLVFHDVLGFGNGHYPKFVRPYANLTETATAALQRFFADVQAGTFPAETETYHTDAETAQALYDARNHHQ